MTPSDQVVAMISKNHITNDKIAFQRRLTNLENFVRDQINPFEEEILLIREKLIPLYDKSTELRKEAMEYCTHPPEFLDQQDNPDDPEMLIVRCKFCSEIFHVKK